MRMYVAKLPKVCNWSIIYTYVCICVQDIQIPQQPQGMMEYAVVDKTKKKVDRQQNVSQQTMEIRSYINLTKINKNAATR